MALRADKNLNYVSQNKKFEVDNVMCEEKDERKR
jgi:hypothetical protein